GGEAMAENMGPLAGVSADTGTRERGPCDHCDRATTCETDVRNLRAEKQSATRRLRATMTQVGDDSCADVRGDRHPGSPPAFSANEHLAGSPVDIIQGEGRDFAGPHPELRQHHENGVVPPSHGSCSVATVEDLLNLCS